MEIQQRFALRTRKTTRKKTRSHHKNVALLVVLADRGICCPASTEPAERTRPKTLRSVARLIAAPTTEPVEPARDD
jgi:hypothetical protein